MSRPVDGPSPRSRGRRPAGEDTRSAILATARAEFAERGYDATSLRGIARRAEVDPALVHHYFEGKPALFAQIMAVPARPDQVVDAILGGPRDRVGERLAQGFFGVWDAPESRDRMSALVRSAVTHEEAARMLREFLAREVFGRIARAYAPGGDAGDGGPPDHELRAGAAAPDHELRAGVAAAQMIGVAMMRYVLAYPPVVDASVEELTDLLAPTLQRYLVP